MTGIDPTSAPQVLVVGAGPTGLALAHELVRGGVRVRLVDAKPEPARTSRAVATHPRTLEIYEQMGVLDGVLALGQRITAFTLFQNGALMTRLDADYRRMPTRHPFTVCIDQVLTEKVLREAVSGLGVEVEWGVRLAEVSQDGERARAVLEHPDGSRERLVVPWLVGCDGGHSEVRRQLGLSLLGESSDTWLIADADLDVDLPRNSIYWVRNRGLAMMLAPMSGARRWRLLDTQAGERDGDPDLVAARFRAQLAEGLGRPVGMSRPEWVSVFTFQQRMIERMRAGRCFVAGDAAHVHSPASGQGMNTGIQDAYNLAWKLSMVVHGQAEDRLLDTYSAERVPVGAALLRSTSNATGLIQLRSRPISALLPVLFAVVRTVAPLRRRIQRRILGGVSGLNLRYEAGPLTHNGAAERGPAAGERITGIPDDAAAGPGWKALCERLRTPCWQLLLGTEARQAAGELRRSAPAWLNVSVVDTRGGGDLPDPDGELTAGLGLTPSGWLLVRPDGYLSARGERVDAGVVATVLADAGLVTDQRS